MQTLKLNDIETTKDVQIPQDPLERVIGQDNAIEIARICAKQKRHLLLVGPPGTGKSMIAQAMSFHLGKTTEEIQVVHNPENPERPFVEVKTEKEVMSEREFRMSFEGEIILPEKAPQNVSEQLGFRCVNCGTFSSWQEHTCPKCQNSKRGVKKASAQNPFGDLIGVIELTINQIGMKDRVSTTQIKHGKEEVVVYERAGEKIRVLDQKALEKRREFERLSPRKILVPFERKTFILATGSSETELLGDVRHDPYGGHPQLGTQPYERVVAGAIHEAHEGVLFIDELPHLGHLQRYILTAMQEKRFPISGKNPQSAGASVKVDNVPCDFIFVGACNISDLHNILSPLRSRINGNGYEVLIETTMEDNEFNRAKLIQFIAQEIAMDKKIPHANRKAVKEIINEAHKRAKIIDGKDNCLTLRLRELGGLIRTAGDLAVMLGDNLIEEKHIKFAIKRSKTAEQQIKDKYGSYYGGLARDLADAQKSIESPYNYWNQHLQDDRRGYE